jgi:hypothetical protein
MSELTNRQIQPIPDEVLDALPNEAFEALINALPKPVEYLDMSRARIVNDISFEGMDLHPSVLIPMTRQEQVQWRLRHYVRQSPTTASPTSHD